MIIKKYFKILIFAFILLGLFALGFAVGNRVAINKFNALITPGLPKSLKAGRYYVDGNTEQYYLDVSPEGTILLKDIDYYEYASYKKHYLLTTTTGEELEKVVNTLKDNANKLAQPAKCLAIPAMSVNRSGKIQVWAKDESDKVYTTGYYYIDENTFSAKGKDDVDQTFIFVEEDLWQKAENDGYYTVNGVPSDEAKYTPTRIVDSLTYKKNHGIE